MQYFSMDFWGVKGWATVFKYDFRIDYSIKVTAKKKSYLLGLFLGFWRSRQDSNLRPFA